MDDEGAALALDVLADAAGHGTSWLSEWAVKELTSVPEGWTGRAVEILVGALAGADESSRLVIERAIDGLESARVARDARP